VFASVAMVVILMGYVLCVPKKNLWAPRLGLKTVTDSAVVTRNLASGSFVIAMMAVRSPAFLQCLPSGFKSQ
jgi:hypothetical protein